MYVPAATPLQVGHAVRLEMGAVSRPEFAGLANTPIPATVVRVDRRSILSSGHLAVALRFNPE